MQVSDQMQTNTIPCVLAVDDQPENLMVIKGYLEELQCKLLLASNGNDAIERAKKMKPDLILLDIYLPDLNGFGVIDRLKNDPDTTHIPVVFVTSASDPQSISKGFTMGAVDYIAKPIRKAELVARVRSHLAITATNKYLESEVELRTREAVAARKQTERTLKELQKARNYISNIINSMPSLLVSVDTSCHITQWNFEAARQTGIDADHALGRRIDHLLPRLKQETERITEAIQTRTDINRAKHVVTKDGKLSYENISIYPLVANGVEGAVIRIDDVSEQVQIEEMMIQSEKMLSVGGLAAGMAHEINNPLAGMMQTAAVVQQRLDDIDNARNKKTADEIGVSLPQIKQYMEKRQIFEMLDRIKDSGQQAVDIVQNMLSFSRKGNDVMSTHALPDLIDKCVELSRIDYDLKKKYDFKQISIEKDYDPLAPPILCEASKLQQVFMNLLRNASEAMWDERLHLPDGTNKNSSIHISVAPIGHNRVQVTFADNGPGMTAEVRKRVFEPFFTTKPTDMGTGLGLSVSYFIIKETHDGDFRVESHPGQGTTFYIELPVQPSPPNQ